MRYTVLIYLPEGFFNPVPCRLDTPPEKRLLEVVLDPFGPGPLFRARTWMVRGKTSGVLYLLRTACHDFLGKYFSRSCRHSCRQRIQELRLMPPKIMRLKLAQHRDPKARADHERAVKLRRERIAVLAREHGTK